MSTTIKSKTYNKMMRNLTDADTKMYGLTIGQIDALWIQPIAELRRKYTTRPKYRSKSTLMIYIAKRKHRFTLPENN